MSQRKTRRLFAIASILSLVLGACHAPSPTTSNPVDSYAPVSASAQSKTVAAAKRQLIVGLKSGRQSFTSGQRLGLKSVRKLRKLNAEVIEVPAGQSLQAIQKKLAADPNVAYVELNHIRRIPKPKLSRVQLSQSRNGSPEAKDPMAAQQYALKKVQAEAAWKKELGKSDIVIAIIDTGIDLDHPELRDKLVPGFSAVPEASTPRDDNGHGTHCAGVASAITGNGIGIAGMAPGCKLMPIKVLAAEGGGTDDGVAQGIIWAVDNGADVLSMSLGGTEPSKTMGEAVEYALSKGVPLIAAMGNDGNDEMNYPAAYPGVIAVGASDDKDGIADFSNFGKWISVVAPGVGVLSTFPTYDVDLNKYGFPHNYATLDGTSMATPYVAGLAGLILSQSKGLSPKEVKEVIEKGADMLTASRDVHAGAGRINADRSLTR